MQLLNCALVYYLQEHFMEDVRLLLRVCVMLLPLPVFWALFDQQVLKILARLRYIKNYILPFLPYSQKLKSLKL